MQKPLLTVLGLLVLSACATPHAGHELSAPAPESISMSWRLGGFAGPESAIMSGDRTFFYVSNVNGSGADKDGNGFISRVTTSGQVLQREWAVGLDAPKGIFLVGDTLYAADIDQIVAIDAATGAVRSRTPVSGATYLNDITSTPDGTILVSDTRGQRIFALRDGATSVWLEDALLDSVNGVLPEADRLIVTTMVANTGRLLAIDYQTRAITVLAEGIGRGDGVGALGQGRYIVSSAPGQMQVVSADGGVRAILDTSGDPRSLNDFHLEGSTLYQAHMNANEVTAYAVMGVR
jgi:hypothetical protein